MYVAVSYTHLDVYKRQALGRWRTDQEEHEYRWYGCPNHCNYRSGTMRTGQALSLIHIFEATEVLKIICGFGEVLSGKLWTIDLRTLQSEKFSL